MSEDNNPTENYRSRPARGRSPRKLDVDPRPVTGRPRPQ